MLRLGPAGRRIRRWPPLLRYRERPGARCRGHAGPRTRRASGVRVFRFTLCCSLAMDGVGLKAARKVRGIPSVMPPKMPPQWLVVVLTCAVFHGEGVVIFAAPEPGGAKADAELDALDGGDAEDDGGDAALHAVKQRVPPVPTGRPSTAHSTMPPTESPSALAAAMAACMASPAASSTTGKGLSAVEAVRGAVSVHLCRWRRCG